FRTVEQRLSGWDSVDQVEVNPLTASVLVTFSDPAALFTENALRNDLFTVAYDEPDGGGAKRSPQALTDRATELWRNADRALRRDGDLKQALDAGLGGNGIRSGSANTCTGTVLILFEPARPLDEIERRVRDVATRRPKARSSSVFSEGPRWHSLGPAKTLTLL